MSAMPVAVVFSVLTWALFGSPFFQFERPPHHTVWVVKAVWWFGLLLWVISFVAALGMTSAVVDAAKR